MNLTDRKSFTGPLLVLALFVSVAATLRYAQEFFLPLVLAGLLSFLLSPLVRRLERWRLGRVGAVLVTAAMAFVLIGGLTYLVTSQFLDLARSLPKYRSNLIARVAALKTNENNPLRLAVRDDQRSHRGAQQAGGHARRPQRCRKSPARCGWRSSRRPSRARFKCSWACCGRSSGRSPMRSW